MPGTIVLNPATVDGYGNPISVERDENRGVNRVFGTTKIEGQPHIELFDANGNPVSTGVDGNNIMLFVRDEEQLSLLYDISNQIKKMTFYLSQIVDQEED
jgi:hypothetical protein